ncbi:hypothetical protein FHL15_008241 [Xylaria flabelliformis]|uniref:Uncharacterized protein n=1 Tax=Xylaria flabelliformis TaxID=2512241 RepID=A0A553HSB5_9PEZI|nr:hypothetical protein FHL15_008241 [Xylaria flabelliformis]
MPQDQLCSSGGASCSKDDPPHAIQEYMRADSTIPGHQHKLAEHNKTEEQVKMGRVPKDQDNIRKFEEQFMMERVAKAKEAIRKFEEQWNKK